MPIITIPPPKPPFEINEYPFNGKCLEKAMIYPGIFIPWVYLDCHVKPLEVAFWTGGIFRENHKDKDEIYECVTLFDYLFSLDSSHGQLFRKPEGLLGFELFDWIHSSIDKVEGYPC